MLLIATSAGPWNIPTGGGDDAGALVEDGLMDPFLVQIVANLCAGQGFVEGLSGDLSSVP